LSGSPVMQNHIGVCRLCIKEIVEKMEPEANHGESLKDIIGS